MSVLDCVDEYLSEADSDSDNEIDGNQEYYHYSGTSDSEQSDSGHLQLSGGRIMWTGKWKSACWMSPSGMMSATNITTILRECALGQRMHNLPCMGIGDLNALTMRMQAGF